MQPTLQSIHACFCKLTNQPDLKYPPCERMLFDYHQASFNEDDLRCTLTFMLWCNSKREPRYRDRILFHRIVGDLETFNSRLGEARAWERNRKVKTTPRQEILAATGRAEMGEVKVRKLSEVFQSLAVQP